MRLSALGQALLAESREPTPRSPHSTAALLLALLLALLIGVILGLLGGGGSILTVPVLVYVVGYAAKPAIAMSLPVVGVTSLVGAIFHWRLGNVRLGTAALFGGLTMVGAVAGAKLSLLVSGAMQLALLAVVVLGAALSMMRGGGGEAAATTPAGEREPRPDGKAPARGTATVALLAAVALGVGVLTGLVGVGGGFLVVPALVLLGGVPMRQAVGTSLLVIAMNCFAGFFGHLAHTAVDWRFLGLFSGLAVAGVLAGSAAAARVPQLVLRRAFAIFLLAVGGFLLYENRSAFQLSALGDGSEWFTVNG